MDPPLNGAGATQPDQSHPLTEPFGVANGSHPSTVQEPLTRTIALTHRTICSSQWLWVVRDSLVLSGGIHWLLQMVQSVKRVLLVLSGIHWLPQMVLGRAWFARTEW
jgi:hypothetical protein